MDTKVQQDQVQIETRRKMANAMRTLSMDAVQKTNSGHPGLPGAGGALRSASVTTDLVLQI